MGSICLLEKLFSEKLVVFDNIIFQIPNIVSANNDGVNDVLSISKNEQFN
jgi:hypothetical protein